MHKLKMKSRALSTCLALPLLAGIFLNSCSQSEYTVNFDANNGAGDILSSQTVSAGNTIAASDTPIRDGYVFLGWFQDAGLTQPWNTTRTRSGQI